MPQHSFNAAPLASTVDFAACRAAIRTGSRSFYAASLLLPRRLRDPAYALYAFCRMSDDAVDLEAERGPEGRAAVARLTARLQAAAAGAPEDAAADRAFAETIRAYDVPPELMAALFEGLGWDADGRRYETFDELTDYAARVAGAVGAMMAALMGARDAAQLARACDLGVAMQLTNIARDVGEDARAGRIYLPLAWLRAAGIDPDAFLADPRFTPALGSVIAQLLAEADRLYRRAEIGVARLPKGCRGAIWAARTIYAEIGHEVARAGYDSVSQRATTTTGRKVRLAAWSTMRAFGPVAAPADDPPALRATAYLVDLAERERPPARRTTEERVSSLVDALQRVERLNAQRLTEMVQR